MAEPTNEPVELTERPKEPTGEGNGEKGPSKAALKKAAKDKEKVRIAHMTVPMQVLG